MTGGEAAQFLVGLRRDLAKGLLHKARQMGSRPSMMRVGDLAWLPSAPLIAGSLHFLSLLSTIEPQPESRSGVAERAVRVSPCRRSTPSLNMPAIARLAQA